MTELLIVISIIAILIAIAIPRFSKSNLSAQAAAHNVNVREIKNAAILYMTDKSDDNITSISIDELSDYFDNEIPKPAKSLGKSFSIQIDNSGNIIVKPGNVKVEGNKLVEDSRGK